MKRIKVRDTRKILRELGCKLSRTGKHEVWHTPSGVMFTLARGGNNAEISMFVQQSLRNALEQSGIKHHPF